MFQADHNYKETHISILTNNKVIHKINYLLSHYSLQDILSFLPVYFQQVFSSTVEDPFNAIIYMGAFISNSK